MPLTSIGVIEIPAAAGSSFDHGAFDPRSRRVFVAHTGRDCIEVIDHDAVAMSQRCRASRKPPASSPMTGMSW
jgi:hypothetical protein